MKAAASSYLSDYAVGKAAASALATKPALKGSITEMQGQLIAAGYGGGLPLGTWTTAWENAYNQYLEAGVPQAQRPQSTDAQLFDALVDQNPKCFSPDIRAQVKVNEGS